MGASSELQWLRMELLPPFLFFWRAFSPSPWFVPPKTLLLGSRRAREARKPSVPRGAVRGASPAFARSSPRGGSAPSAWLRWQQRPTWLRGTGVRTSGQQAQRPGWTGDEPAPLAPWLARGRAQRRLPRHSAGPRPRRPRQPSGSAPSGAAPGMSALCGGVQGQGRRLEHAGSPPESCLGWECWHPAPGPAFPHLAPRVSVAQHKK